MTSILYPRPPTDHGATVNATVTLNAADEAYAVIMPAPKTGTIGTIHFLLNTHTTNGDVDVRIETVGADGFPTGTLWATNTNSVESLTTSFQQVNASLTAGASVTRGDVIAIVIRADSTSVPITQLRLITNADLQENGFPCVPEDVSSPPNNWANRGVGNGVNIVVEYNDGTFAHCPGVSWVQGTRHETFGSGSTPDEVGNVIQIPFGCTVGGIWASCRYDAGTTFDAILYDASDTVLESVTVDTDIADNHSTTANRNNNGFFYFDTDVDVSANTDYRVALQATAVGTFILHGFGTNTNASYLDIYDADRNTHKTERTNEGTWTDTSHERMYIGVIITDISGGGGVPGNMRGNMQ